MPAEYLACVASQTKAGKPRATAQRICAIAYYKRHGVSPTKAAGEADMATHRKRLLAKVRAAEERGDGEAVEDLRALMERSITEATKTEDGDSYPASAFAYVPDAKKPSTWKLRLWESPTKKVTVAQLGRAAAAFSSGGFRGQKVQLPAGAVAGAKAKIRAAYRKLGTKAEDMPDGVQEQMLSGGVFGAYEVAGATEVYLPADAALQEGAYVDITGSYEATISELRRAVRANAALFGATEDEPWGLGIAGSFPGRVVVSGPDDSLYRASWKRGEDGAIALTDVQKVRVTLQADGDRIPVADAPDGDEPTADGQGADFLSGGTAETELLETYIAQVRVLEETDAVDEGGTATGDHLMAVECLLGLAETPTRNGRVYPRSLFEKLVAESTEGTARSKRWLGEADHPPDALPRLSETISTPWRALRLDETGQLFGTTSIIDTSRGADVQKLIRNGVPVQVSSRTLAKLTTEVRDGATVQVVDEVTAIDHWGGWDFVLGAAAHSEEQNAGVMAYREQRGQPAATAEDSGETRDSDEIDEALADMDAKELVATIERTIAEKIPGILKPLLESNKPADDGGDKKPDGEADKDKGNGHADSTDVLARIDETLRGMSERMEKSDAATAAALDAKVLGEARTAIMEREEIKAWSGPARKLLDAELKKVTKADDLAPRFKDVVDTLQEVGILIIGKSAGKGIAAVHVSQSAEMDGKERARLAQTGSLPDDLKPRTVSEVLDLFCEGIEDNGMRSSTSEDDPIRAELGGTIPFPGYHPGNPRHQFRVAVLNTMRAEGGKYLRPHMHPDVRAAMEWTGAAAVAQTVPFVLPTIRQVWPRLIATELCSVQPMTKSTGIVHYLDFLYDPAGGNPAVPGEFVSDYAQYVSEQDAVPEVQLTLTHADITMDTKKLKAEWSTEVRQNLAADHGLDIASEMVNFMADEIAREVNALLINDMRLTADPNGVITAGNVNFGCLLPAAGYVNLGDWQKELYRHILQADALVRAQRRARTNWLVCGPNALIRLMRLENWRMAALDAEGRDWNVGINRVGTLEGNPSYKVYSCDADFFPTEMILLGRRGPEWPDAGEIYCPFIPIFTTPVFVDPNTFCEREAVMSRFGYRKVIGNAFSTVTCLPAAQGVVW